MNTMYTAEVSDIYLTYCSISLLQYRMPRPQMYRSPHPVFVVSHFMKLTSILVNVINLQLFFKNTTPLSCKIFERGFLWGFFFFFATTGSKNHYDFTVLPIVTLK